MGARRQPKVKTDIYILKSIAQQYSGLTIGCGLRHWKIMPDFRLKSSILQIILL